MDGIIITPLRIIYTPKGEVLHALKKSENSFFGFGEAYFSIVRKGEIKGWKKHKKMILNLVVPIGEIQFVIYNEFSNKFFQIKLSQKNYKRLTIKPNLWFAFKGLDEYNMLLNIANIEHDPKESINKKLNDIKFNWKDSNE